MVEYNTIAGLTNIILGLILVIFNQSMGDFFSRLTGMRREIDDTFIKKWPIKYAKYDPKNKYGKTMIILGIFFIIMGIMFLTGLTKYFVN